MTNGKKRRITYNHDGYPVCSVKCLRKDGRMSCRSVAVHILVATAFIPNPDNLPEVNHKDYNRTNAHVDNLEWITHADNVRYSNCNRPDMRGSKNPNYGNHKLSEKYRADLALAKEKQSRPKAQNGRAKKVDVFYDGKFVKHLDYIGQGADFLKQEYGIHVTDTNFRYGVLRSMKKNISYYKHFTFKYA